GVALHRLAADPDAAHARAARIAHDAGDLAEMQPGAGSLGSAHHLRREQGGMDLGRALRRAEPLADGDIVAEPLQSARAAASRAARLRARPPGVAGHAPIAPGFPAEALGELGMQGKAAPRQALERAAVAPVARQEAARLAGGGAG